MGDFLSGGGLGQSACEGSFASKWYCGMVWYVMVCKWASGLVSIVVVDLWSGGVR